MSNSLVNNFEVCVFYYLISTQTHQTSTLIFLFLVLPCHVMACSLTLLKTSSVNVNQTMLETDARLVVQDILENQTLMMASVSPVSAMETLT